MYKGRQPFFWVALFILFWPIFLLMFAAIGVSLGRTAQAMITSAPIVIILWHIGFLSVYRSFTTKVVRYEWWFLCVYLFCVSLVLSFVSSLFAGQNAIDALSSFKTIGQFPVILTWVILIFYSTNIKERIDIADWLFSVCLIPAGFIIVETAMKIATPSLMDYIYSLSEMAEFGGANYLAYGDLDYGLLQGARPLGFYFDMMTSATIAFIACIYFAWRKSYLKLMVAFLSVLLSFRLTLFLSLIPILSLVIFPRAYRIVAALLIGTGIASLPVLYNYFNQINSSSIIIEHLVGHLYHLFDRSFIEILVGSGWIRSEESSIVGYSEVFVYRYLEYFGVIGIIALAFLIVRPMFLALRFRSVNFSDSSYKVHTGSLAMAIGLSLIPMVIHYNLFFTGPVLLQFVIIVMLIDSNPASIISRNLIESHNNSRSV